MIRLKILSFLILLNLNYSQITYEKSDNPADSDFPGGYISLGIQFGKNNDGIKFRSYQINLGLGVTTFPQSFLGITLGNRIFKNESNYQYMDLQFTCAFISGVGIGIVRKNNKIYNRKKGWIGLGPVMYSKDWLNINNNPEINRGIMLSLPAFFVFGNAFYP